MANKSTEALNKEQDVIVKSAKKFTYEQIIHSKRFKADVDIISAVLDHNGNYSADEVTDAIETFKTRKVGK